MMRHYSTEHGHGIEAGDSARLAGALAGRFSAPTPVSRFYDDGSGPVWIYQDAGGLLAIVRADTWEDAWAICEDEIFDDVDPDRLAEVMAEALAEVMAEDPTLDEDTARQKVYDSGADMPEGCGYRNSGAGSNHWNQTHSYSEDLNGSVLELLTAEQMEQHGIVLQWEVWR